MAASAARLIVRRVRRLDPKAVAGQGELFTLWRYHAVFTTTRTRWCKPTQSIAVTPSSNRPLADLISGPLAHLPSGHIGANGAWMAATAHNLTRAAGCLAGGELTRPGVTPSASG